MKLRLHLGYHCGGPDDFRVELVEAKEYKRQVADDKAQAERDGRLLANFLYRHMWIAQVDAVMKEWKRLHGSI